MKATAISLFQATALICAPALAGSSPTSPNGTNQTRQTQTTGDRYRSLGPGINIGNYFEATSFKGGEISDHPKILWEKGFRHVRLPINWSANASEDASATINPIFSREVLNATNEFLNQGFTVILNIHHYRELDGDPPTPTQKPIKNEVINTRFISMWKQISELFRKHDNNRLWFEIYNEPHGRLSSTEWNSLLRASLSEIRKQNPTKTVIIGPINWNNANSLDKLDIPNTDPNIVATIHNYEPFNFTHQQARWAGPTLAATKGVYCCNQYQIERIKAPLETANRWSKKNGIPILLGEFGAYKGPKDTPNDTKSRANYTQITRKAAESLGMAWTYWEFNSGFGIYDTSTKKWDDDVLDALTKD